MPKLIVGLGNPGAEYAGTRHNLGFDVVDKIVAGKIASPEMNKKINALVYKLPDLILIKPQTFMNLSGRSVKAAVDFYKVGLGNLLIIHDEVDLEFGEIKHQFDRGSAGHNGVESIVNSLGSQAFHRLRLGVGRGDNSKIDTSDFVLQKFPKDEEEVVKRLIARAAETAINWTEHSQDR